MQPKRQSKTDHNKRFSLILIGIIIVLALVSVLLLQQRNRVQEEPKKAPVVTKKAKVEEKAVVQPTAHVEEAEEETIIDEEPSPGFVKQHSEQLIGVLNMQLRGARQSLAVTKDPKQVAEIKRRIAMVEQYVKRLESIDPNDQSTWFFMRNQDPLRNNILDIQQEDSSK